ncbi:MAG: hypothetical protein HOV68_33370 [Streptomycetaceae bacterium]|nr:hypothetical protein [Streptomycetaceae bacterium]
MQVGDKVTATKTITGTLRGTVPQGAKGVVTEVDYAGIHVTFTIPGLMGGTRTQLVAVKRFEIAKL